ncbi:hypothetical protein PV08_02969 [Exophiala spinifera]|uniref:thioredoxin-dependent peroxiredoxin n=1 Tax=Exophiala spinifera TaxID=91928 RepID=A0A0D2BJB3_9EURO|nr:uncharacterized protein PV08_02969 [Exophiala spinifera]KIW18680.1 hypothetical protein PV08_02969 [Exophiala spinifera]
MTTGTLQGQLDQIVEHFKAVAPESVRSVIFKATDDFAASFDPKSTIQVGDTLPAFSLTDAVGKQVRSADLLAKGRGIVVTFYRGEWCPFCNLALAALQKRLADFEARGVTLVAVTPELPTSALSTVEKNELKFAVLSDVGNKYAAELGIVWVQPDSLREPFAKFGHDLEKRNGDDSFAVPIPATLLVNSSGKVRNTFIDPDYKKRVEPSQVLEWIDAL